jgi:hypothetical protein
MPILEHALFTLCSNMMGHQPPCNMSHLACCSGMIELSNLGTWPSSPVVQAECTQTLLEYVLQALGIMGHSLSCIKYSFTYCFGIRHDSTTPFLEYAILHIYFKHFGTPSLSEHTLLHTLFRQHVTKPLLEHARLHMLRNDGTRTLLEYALLHTFRRNGLPTILQQVFLHMLFRHSGTRTVLQHAPFHILFRHDGIKAVLEHVLLSG